jgi:SET domain-containing protein
VNYRGLSHAAWVATRDIAAGEEVTWTYGDLSSEELWLW